MRGGGTGQVPSGGGVQRPERPGVPRRFAQSQQRLHRDRQVDLRRDPFPTPLAGLFALPAAPTRRRWPARRRLSPAAPAILAILVFAGIGVIGVIAVPGGGVFARARAIAALDAGVAL